MKTQRQNLGFVQPLVITPSPYKGESLPGFILRTAELNGYDSPNQMLNYAGLDENEMRSARPPLEKLAPLFGKTIDEFLTFKLDRLSKSKGRYVEVMGHDIFSIFTSCKNSRLCLECIREYGCVEGFFELKYAVACPKHRIKTIKNCNVCHKPLKWHRLGLSRCDCGAELNRSSQDAIEDPAVIALLDVLYCKLMGAPLNHKSMIACGFPSKALEQMSVQTLLSIIYRFGLFNSKDNAEDPDDEIRAVEITAKVFTNWPTQFHEYLDKIHGPNVNFEFIGLRAQFRSFYESFFKNIEHSQEMIFMREAFISFGQKYWKKASIHPKFNPNKTPSLIGINSLSESIDIHHKTIRMLVSKGLVKTTNQHQHRSRLLFDEADQLQFEFAQGKSLSIRTAAAKLHLPVEILRAYREKGFYQASHLATPIALFHERDVEQMREDLIKNCQLYTISNDKKFTTLEQVMRMKFTAEIKAMFISEVVKRQIVPVGIQEGKPSGLVFDKLLVIKLLHQFKESLHGTISFQHAETLLSISRKPLLSLVKAQLLDYKFQNNTFRLDEKSVLVFHEQI